MRQISGRNLAAGLAFAAALALTLFFLVRLIMGSVYWADPRHSDQAIEGWMTPRYVARSWHVPPEAIAAPLGMERDGTGHRVTLQELAARQNRSLDALIADLEAAIARVRDQRNE